MGVRPLQVPKTEREQEKFEREYVSEVYGKISKHFSSTRRKPWPVVKRYVNSQEVGSVGVDVGCGNYRNVVNKNVFISGCDK